MKIKYKKIKYIAYLQLLFLLFSGASVCLKLAALYGIFTIEFLAFFAASLIIMGVYAVLWQQILKKMPLSTAIANSAISVVWSMIWGYFLFNETITIGMMISTAIIIFGIYLVVTADV